MSQTSEPSDLRWIVAQEGSRQTYAVPLAFHRLGVLRSLYVDIWCRSGRSLLRRGTHGLRALATRFNPEIPKEKVVSFNLGALASRVALHRHLTEWPLERLAYEYCRFGRWFATRVRQHLKGVILEPTRDVFFGFNTNCLETLEWLRTAEITTVVDQVDPGKVEEDVVIEEAERWPGWSRVPGRLPQFYWDRLKAEWNAADIVLVNSEWSADALAKQGVPRKKVIVIPLAVDLAADAAQEPTQPQGSLQVLWLGSVILRKGIQYLVDAARVLAGHDVEFLLAGPIGISDQALSTFPPNIKLLGRVTRDRLGEVYRRAHVFVLPTLSDGFGITQLEAMAHGLPVIATPNCGRVVTNGLDGFIVPARDREALVDAIFRFHSDRKLLRDMSYNALRTVRLYDLPSNARLIQREVTPHHRGQRRSAPFIELTPRQPGFALS
jgi:glycosyltransferase involved in cell wall biosynthesis